MQVNHEQQEFLTEEEAARFLNVSIRTLPKWRSEGIGPKFCKFGRSIRYHKVELRLWAKHRMRISTSEY